MTSYSSVISKIKPKEEKDISKLKLISVIFTQQRSTQTLILPNIVLYVLVWKCIIISVIIHFCNAPKSQSSHTTLIFQNPFSNESGENVFNVFVDIKRAHYLKMVNVHANFFKIPFVFYCLFSLFYQKFYLRKG